MRASERASKWASEDEGRGTSEDQQNQDQEEPLESCLSSSPLILQKSTSSIW